MSRYLAQIHIAKKALALDEDSYRDVLERVTGKRSAKGLSEGQCLRVVTEFKRLGWKPVKRGGSFRPASDKGHVRMLFALAKSLDGLGYWQTPYKDALRSFVKKRSDVDDPEWLTYSQASPLIEALKVIEGRLAG
ncbi:regulatory protein GemA [Pseudovibrio sp. Tun.PSC04-5.I4]|uniref:regulatory protein GemA n=1 Tax=Pseudovibrio sp. Tun.PSC04-5.I4 TaxID=1798213 RepID=UPI000882B5D2|nr:regulatory protein GemA [Pseudovibrio sp. Tun.PSC04-5.I4]SDR15872.1 Mu-like prophage protein gp16 [Pseudovibrio sp. Tun.PSC04-5.I4]SDR40394.1 Mu-like prophage protein gp16 [Pseudovibrio sp. Tun.PSC04-5.I4]